MRIAVIGAGFSGTMAAVHILRMHADARVVLVERSGRFGPGLAYATSSPVHYLNVPAGNMSAFDDDPGHFLRWAQRKDPAVATGSFLPRGLYGDYLESLLAGDHGAGERLERIRGDAVAIDTSSTPLRIRLASGTTLEADRVVLALGNALPPHPPLAVQPAGVARELFESGLDGAYIRDPWDLRALESIRADEPILVVGTGLTMMDVVMSLQARDHAGRILAISRHGLLPRPHRSPSRPPAHKAPPDALNSWDGSARALLHILRRAVADNASRGTDWRDVITSIRPITAALWQRMSERERERFCDRLRSYWEIVRHRAAPETAAAVADLVASRRLAVRAGRLLSIRRAPGVDRLVEVTFRPRGSLNAQTVRIGRIINCLGPDTDIRRAKDPLLASLLASGMITADPLGLGIETTADGAVIGKHRKPDERILVIGPHRKAHAWENTAVPELRKHAAALAQRLTRPR